MWLHVGFRKRSFRHEAPPPALTVPSDEPLSRRHSRRMIAPTVALWSCGVLAGLFPVLEYYGATINSVSLSLWRVAVAVAISTWVMADARRRGRALCHDFDSFMFFAWPLLGPVYLWQTRRWRAGITLGWFAVFLLVSMAGDLWLQWRG